MATPSPGAGLTEGLQNGPASNRFARELAHPDSVSKLVEYMLTDFGVGSNAATTTETQSNPFQMSDMSTPPESPSSSSSVLLPNAQSSTSSLVHSISVIIELIRKNNSDYFEPYLFHTLRNRLIQVQQHLQTHTDDGREALELAMKEMVDRMGVVHLGSVLEIMCDKLDRFQHYLREPRSLVSRRTLLSGLTAFDHVARMVPSPPPLARSSHLHSSAIAYANYFPNCCIALTWPF